MKQVWIKVDPWDKTKVLAALEAGADGILLPNGGADRVRELGIITTIAPDGDLVWEKDVIPWQVKDQEDVVRTKDVPGNVILVVEAQDWKVIPWENLVAARARTYALVSREEDASTALGALERGVEGVVIDTSDTEVMKAVIALVKQEAERLRLSPATVSRILPLGLGDRVCIDTCTQMGQGEGMLVGNGSSGLFLVHAESMENPYVDPRPFRVNAGAVHSYVRLARGETKYLSELSWGDEALVVNTRGETQITYVGRVKVERRPLVLVEAEAAGGGLACILQNAETVRLVDSTEHPLSLAALKPGDQVLVFTETGGRHMGRLVEERIEEG
jgi:3-dehydroquinate synthase II